MFVRRVHLYAGLTLLPWVFLFGITGAMFNHRGLFPQGETTLVPAANLAGTALDELESADEIAVRVLAALRERADGKSIDLIAEHDPEFTGEMLFETWSDGQRHVAHINPVTKSASVISHGLNDHKPKALLDGVNNVQLSPQPMQPAQAAASDVFASAGIKPDRAIKPIGWTKLNFLSQIDGQPARVTYVLKDGHVDVTRYDGSHGMTARGFFLRLHTTHVMSPYWNGRSIWIIAADALAIAMVVWGISGLLMWWQIKRTRVMGSVCILASIATVAWMYVTVAGFYATTKL